MMTFLPLGVGDAFSAQFYSSCLAVRAPGESGDAWLLIDCPHPIRKIMREASQSAGVALDIDAISAVVLTHLHADHASGLEGFCYYSYFALKRRPRIVAHPDVLARLWSGHLAAGMECLMDRSFHVHHKDAADYFDAVPLVENAPLTLGAFTLECRKTIHHVPTTALRVHAGGRSLGYSADTAFDRGLIDWLGAADLVIHETNYGVHTPYSALAELPQDVREKMRLIHYPDDFDRAASVIEPLKQGVLYQV